MTNFDIAWLGLERAGFFCDITQLQELRDAPAAGRAADLCWAVDGIRTDVGVLYARRAPGELRRGCF